MAVLAGPAAGQWRTIAQVIDAHTFVLSAPLPAGTTALSIATGFVNQTFEGNTIDCRGSATAADMVLVGNHFGLTVKDNQILGGQSPLKLVASTTEAPVQWGWSHSPSFGSDVENNVFGPGADPVWLGVERGPYIKSNQGRLYFTANVSGNVFAPSTGTASGPAAAVLGDPLSIDPDESAVTFVGNSAAGPSATVSVPSANVNGTATVDGQLILSALTSPAPLPLLAPTSLRLVHDTGRSATDNVTSDGHLQFDPVLGAAGYEYQVGGTGAFRPLGTATSFLPAGLAAGTNTLAVRAVDAAGTRGPVATISFVLSTAPPVADPPVLDPASDTGRSNSDRITAVKQPVFNVTGAATDLIQLFRGGKLIASRTGPGPLQDPGVSAGGSYSYTLTRTSLAGPTSTSRATVVTIDTTPPAAVGGLTVLSNGKVQFRATQSTDVYEYRVGTSGPYQSLGNATSFTPAGLVVGRNQVYVHAVDLAGNVGPNATVVITVAPPAPVTASWLGQDGADYVGPRATPGGDGIQDVHIVMGNLRPDHAIASLTISAIGGGLWDYNVPSSRNWSAALVRTPGATTANVYIQPYQRETGRKFTIRLTYDDGTTTTVTFTGGEANPTLRVTPVPTVKKPASVLPRTITSILWWRR